MNWTETKASLQINKIQNMASEVELVQSALSMFQIVGSHSILCRKALIYQLITLNIKWLTSEMLPVDTLSQPVATATFFRRHKNVQCLPIGKIKSNVPT